MGAIFSYLSYDGYQQPYDHGTATSPSVIDLCTRLGALDKELQISRSENANKDAIIRYLLQSCATSFSRHSYSQAKDEISTQNLIDLLDGSQESGISKLTEEDTTLMEEFSEDLSEAEGVENTTPDSSLNRSFGSEFEESSYIVRFADADTKFPKESSQLETLALGRDGHGDSEKTVGIINKTAPGLPNFDMHKQAEPMVAASSKLQDLPIKVNASAIEPRWSISETFKSIREREDAASLNRFNGGPNGLLYPDIFKYGVHFIPLDSERDVYRTIVISNLSPDTNLGTLLNHVRGGSVIDAQLLDTVKITGKKSALIIFLHEHAALAFEDYTKENPITINGIVAQVHLVSTPTWPIRLPIRNAIFDHQHTRCLKVFNLPKQISAYKFRADLNAHMNTKYDHITYMQKATDGSVEIHLSSIDWAGRAYGMLSTYRAYQDCTPLFSPDPCARPLETLGWQRMAGVAEAKKVTNNGTSLGAVSVTEQHSGRLATNPWQCKAEQCRGRGFTMRS